MRYDLIVIGSDPSGRQGALAAAKLHKKVALIEQRPAELNGVCAPFGKLPAKALRDAVLLLTGFHHRAVYPQLFERRRDVTIPQLHQLANQVVQQESDGVSRQLHNHGVDLLSGRARFVGSHEIELAEDGRLSRRLTSDKFLIAVGSKPNRPNWVPFDERTVIDRDELFRLDRVPSTMIVVGAGLVGMEYALMFAVLGSQVVVTDGKPALLEFCDRELVHLLRSQAEALGVRFRLGKSVTGIERTEPRGVAVKLAGDSRLLADTVLYAAGRSGNTEQLDLPTAGLIPDEHGRLWCNEHHQTWVKHIYGVGDVVGFPALASVSLGQGRRAVQHAFGISSSDSWPIPYGLFTIPELAMIGPTEERLSEERIPYEVGSANFQEVLRGPVSGGAEGRLKLLFHRDSKQLLSVHCLGDSATELIDIGQAVMSFGGSIEHFRDTSRDDPTIADCYCMAANNGLQHLTTQIARDDCEHSPQRLAQVSRQASGAGRRKTKITGRV